MLGSQELHDMRLRAVSTEVGNDANQSFQGQFDCFIDAAISYGKSS